MVEALRRWTPRQRVEVQLTLSSLRRGRTDPTVRFARDGSVWRATRTAEGPALVHIVPQPSEGVVEGRAWGPGCHVALDGLPDLLGASDDSSGFTPRPDHWRLVQAWRQRPGWRVPRSRAVFEALAAAALEQVVTGVEARRAWSHLVRRFGEPAPGSPGHGAGPGAELFVPPGPEQWASIPSWEWLAAGVEERRRRVIQRAARCAGRLEQTVWLPPSEAERSLRAVAGVGVWTAAEVRQRAHGDADAFSFGDFHVARNVSWALTGRVMDDDECAELIQCYSGHRYRVQRLLELSGTARPRRGPRKALPQHVPGR